MKIHNHPKTNTTVPFSANVPRLFTCEEAASILQLPVQTVWKYCRNGILPHRKFSRKCIRIAESDLQSLLSTSAR
jgi:excisionase family DNA binding protein